ncbi:GH39 family glycosyl hydrolase [Shinella sp.]|uniref:GH39 family glycosyl hydrolase n=1 Tax=Shinella sp. TaxID=1870904 RepID=UPI003F6EB7C8
MTTDRIAKLAVNAGAPIGAMRKLHGTTGIPAPAAGADSVPDILDVWKAARVTLVRSYDWVSRLDTVDNPTSLFPDWSADPSDPANYNFASTDAWVGQVRSLGADIMFTIASEIPANKQPVRDLAKYEQVVENIVRHYVCGWGNGFENAITHWEFGDQPDFGSLHFSGTPEQFYQMYAAAARAVKRVDPGLKFGGPCIAFPLNEGPFREGLLTFIKDRSLPLDFLSWMWYGDNSRDPLDFRTIAAEVRAVADKHGFSDARLMLSYWSMTGIPTAKFEDADNAAFIAAAAVYMQDSAVDAAIFFRADTGADFHYKFRDPAGIFEPDGGENARTSAFRLVGQTLDATERLAVAGGDENGFTALAGQTADGDTVRILIANYAIPDSYLIARDRDVFEFQVPIGTERVNMSLNVPPRRVDAGSAGYTGYTLDVSDLPWGRGRYKVVRYRADAQHKGDMLGSYEGEGGSVTIESSLPAPGVELIEITRIPS